MDLLRLALERSKTSLDAIKIITSLMDQFGQGGACGENDSSLNYHNSYIPNTDNTQNQLHDIQKLRMVIFLYDDSLPCSA